MTEGSASARRDRILSAATQEFAHHGFAGARVERIAASAGVNKQLLFHYFGSKSGLYRATLRSLLERSTPAGKAGGPPAERLRDLTNQVVATAEAHPALLALLASPEHDPEAMAVADDWRGRANRQTVQILEDGQRAGYVRDDAEIEAVSEVIVGASLGWAAAGGPKTTGRREKYQETLLKMAVDYCSWR